MTGGGDQVGAQADDPAPAYVRLALRVDRLLPGSVDTYVGDPALRREVESGPPPAPADLVREARRLAREIEGGGLAPGRRAFLSAQLRAIECIARRLDGEDVPYVDEVRLCFDTVPELGERDVYRRSHRELDALLPGRGPLAERLAAYRSRDEVPRRRLPAALAALSGALRERVRGPYGLPPGEQVEYRVVDDAPWSALQQHRGGLRSRVSVNAGARPRAGQLALLVAHEAYPGHHTEQCVAQVGPTGRDGRTEHTVFLVNSPQSVVIEGLADLGLATAVGPGWGAWSAEVLAGAGVRTDGALAERVDDATAPLARVRQDAALLLHAHGAEPAEVRAFLRRWLLVDDDRAGRILRFLAHPLWRAYTTTYVEGAPLLRGWLGRPGPETAVQRHRRLLEEPAPPSALRAAGPAAA